MLCARHPATLESRRVTEVTIQLRRSNANTEKILVNNATCFIAQGKLPRAGKPLHGTLKDGKLGELDILEHSQ